MLRGYLTKIAATLSALSGAVGAVFHFVDPASQYAMELSSAWTLIVAGLAAWGLRRAIPEAPK